MTSRRRVSLSELQPSQLYVSDEKLAVVASRGGGPVDPLPVKELSGRLVLTDGHTRALAAHLRGDTEVTVAPDEDDIDWEAYEICVSWCLDEGVASVADLEGRVVPQSTYEELWLDRCRAMHKSLEEARRGGPDDEVL